MNRSHFVHKRRKKAVGKTKYITKIKLNLAKKNSYTYRPKFFEGFCQYFLVGDRRWKREPYFVQKRRKKYEQKNKIYNKNQFKFGKKSSYTYGPMFSEGSCQKSCKGDSK